MQGVGVQGRGVQGRDGQGVGVQGGGVQGDGHIVDTATDTVTYTAAEVGRAPKILRGCSIFRCLGSILMKFLQKYIISNKFCL